MKPDAKRRLVMSLVSLALAFGLLATYYIITVPWNRTAVGQALTAGALMGISALVVQFIPIRKPVPAVTAPQTPAPEHVPTRSWQPEPEFGPDDFAADLMTQPDSNVEPVLAPSPIGLPPMSAASLVSAPHEAPASNPVIIHPATPEPIPIIIAPEPPAPLKEPHPPIIPPEPASAPTPQPAPEPLVAAMVTAGTKDPTDALTVGEIKDSGDVLRVRNDHVTIDEAPILAPRPMPSVAAQPQRVITVRAMPSITPSQAPRRPPGLSAPASEWREPDPEAPRELLRELAEYWHVKYETEKKRHTEMSTQYEEMLRRLERLEQQAAAETPVARAKKPGPDGAITIEDLNVEDSALKENGADLEERWDQRATQIEHFH